MNGHTTGHGAAFAAGPTGTEELFLVAYAELRAIAAGKLAWEKKGHTLQPTALVCEAWLRIGRDARFENRSHFFGVVAEAMRRILVEHARRKQAIRRGGISRRLDIDQIEIAAPTHNDERLLAVNEALERLARKDPRKAELVKLCYFAGLTLGEAAEILKISERTAKRDWQTAKAWLFSEIDRVGEN